MIKVSLIYPESRVITGYGNYANRLIRGLSGISQIELEKLTVKKREISLMGQPFFGSISQKLGSKTIHPTGDVIHSLTPGVINKYTNVVTIHDIVPLIMKKEFADSLYRRIWYEKMFASILSVKFLIVFTKIAKKEFQDKFSLDDDRVFVVPQSVDHDIFFREPDQSIKKEDKKLIVTVGDLNPRKRFDILFQAVKGRNDLEVVHLGPVNSWSAQRMKLLELIGDQPNIKMLGQVDNNTLRRYYSSADLLVHLSEAEGFASPTVEAMACGTNVLVNDLPLFHETLDSLVTYTSLEPEAVTASIDAALNNKRSSKELMAYTQRYSIEQMGSNTLEVYKRAMADK